ncbi:ESF2/ABP1 family protein [Fistulifera solaris]|uniref:ESF2/ABP1 family protein n=1 Tax=Fistulifera solaris TaxID=1519565 RepID=A0A1Z5KLM7_FISSO|nr:ESF2/ABP1 family protein [Fistulifera solaris]|eukprot:GAX26931.1 ESF2/ABP1 family protein [Fistulifera solaris]
MTTNEEEDEETVQSNSDQGSVDSQNDDLVEKASSDRKVHKLSLRKTEDFNAKLKKRGIVYLARIPPRMTPTKVKTLLGDFGEITRVYLAEEDAAVRKRRRKLSGNGSKRYVEGWIEFASKKVAKHVAASLNSTPITNYKRSAHYGDLWVLKYLSKFEWSHLTEKVAYERRVKEQKLRLETMQARKETAAYKQLVETGKKIDKIEERKRRRAEKEGKMLESETKKFKTTHQIKPIVEGGAKAGKSAILGSLV